MTPKNLAKKLAQFALTKKADNVVLMDLRKLTDMADFFVVCSADSDVQVKAISDAMVDGAEKIGVSAWHREGFAQRQWILLDYVDVVVHVYHREARKYYNLERLWGDAAIEEVSDDVKPKPKTPRRTVKAKKSR